MYGNILYCTHISSRESETGAGGLGYSEFQVTGMIELGQKSKQKKSLRPSIIRQKIHGPKINPQQKPMGHGAPHPKTFHAEFPSLKTYQALNDITQQIKKLKENLHNYAGRTQIFNTSPPPSKKKSFSCSYLKNPLIEIFKAQNIPRPSLHYRNMPIEKRHLWKEGYPLCFASKNKVSKTTIVFGLLWTS